MGQSLNPLLHELLNVETFLSIDELPRTVADRLEWDDIGVVDSRHCDWRRGEEMIG